MSRQARLEQRSYSPPPASRTYTLRIRDLPQTEKPRERLLSLGVDALSSQELLAIILGTGTSREGVLAMTKRIMREYGDGGILQCRDPKRMSETFRIPLGKAMQITAAAALGRRFYEKNAASAPTIRSGSDVFSHVYDMRHAPKERLRGLYLNAQYKLIHDEVISIGTVDASLIHPREVFKPALEHSAAAVIVVHNHPSGSLEPSPQDSAITSQLIDAGRVLGIDLIDHIIVTADAFFSIPAPYSL